MSPTTNPSTLHLPPGWHLEPREACQPRGADPRPLLTDCDGHTLAVVERWTPDDDLN